METMGAVAERAKIVVLLSGGLDSSTLLYVLKDEGLDPLALAVRYGQKHVRELGAARKIADHAGVELVTADLVHALSPIFNGARSSQVGQKVDVPTGHYADESMKLTIVPNRNMLLLAVAGALAVSRGIKAVAYAAHAGDHPIYPDCRPEFIDAASQALQLGSGIMLLDPFANMSKTAIAQKAHELAVPVEHTYSCYEGRADHCGKCGTCFERKEAFRDAGVPDPTPYETDFGIVEPVAQ